MTQKVLPPGILRGLHLSTMQVFHAEIPDLDPKLSKIVAGLIVNAFAAGMAFELGSTEKGGEMSGTAMELATKFGIAVIKMMKDQKVEESTIEEVLNGLMQAQREMAVIVRKEVQTH